MKSHLKILITTVFSTTLATSCVSQMLQEKAPTFSKDIGYSEPASTFKKVSKTIYPAWKSSQSGNVISIISDCSDTAVVSITNVYQLILDSVEQGKSSKQEARTFQGRPATFFVTEGSVDTQPIVVHSLAFRRKNCVYMSSLSGRPDKIQQDEAVFNQFNESFRFE